MYKYNLVIVNSSWGELDWILPYILEKNKKSKEKYLCYFKSLNLYQDKKYYKDLFSICSEAFEDIVHPDKISIKNFFSVYKYLSIKDIIKIVLSLFTSKSYYFDYHDSLFMDYLYENNIEIEKVYHELGFMDRYKILEYLDKDVILFPHAQTIRGFSFQKDSHNKKNIIKDPFNFEVFKNSRILICDKDERNFWKSVTKIDNYEIVGFPRLQDEWFNYRSKNNIDKTTDKNSILLLIGKYNYIGLGELKIIAKNIFQFAVSKSIKVIVKPHPRNINNFSFFKYLDSFDALYEISSNSVFYESKRSILAISTSKSGACLDAVYNNCPVLEYFRYGNKKNRFLEFEVDGKLTSIYNYYGIVKNVYHNDYLDYLTKIYENKTFRNKLVKSQKSNLMRYLDN
tara:strand:- start:9915 stop:11108 length:1194 start_codon:yes stop_codon:yes gene_type:complete